jgi:hypothetical protein
VESVRTTRSLLSIVGLLVVALLAGAEERRLSVVVGCEPEGNARPICKFQSPEDLVALPGGEAVLVSEYGAMEGNRPGRLALLVVATDERRELWNGGDADAAKASWGDPACPGPPSPAFSPHGIHLSRRGDTLQLLVVQHGGRESIEFFEVSGSGSDWSTSWRGCVVAPEKAWLNSVAALPGGGFVTTKMMDRMESMEDLAEAFSEGLVQGYALEWEPGRGFSVLGGSHGSMPNGVETSADGRLVFLNSSGESEVRRIERATGKVEAKATGIPGLDNARWGSDGRLVVASVTAEGGHSDDFSLCMNLREGACPIPFQIVAIDPKSMETEVLYANEGPPMGGGTVGLLIGKDLFVGSFAGDRILRVTLD